VSLEPSARTISGGVTYAPPPLVPRAGARPVAAHGLAPLPPAVLARVEKEPVAFGATSEKGKLAGRQELHRRQHDRRGYPVEIGFVGDEADLESARAGDQLLAASRGMPMPREPRYQSTRRATADNEVREELVQVFAQAVRTRQRTGGGGGSVDGRSPKSSGGLCIENSRALAPDEQITVTPQALSRSAARARAGGVDEVETQTAADQRRVVDREQRSRSSHRTT
jgi:hypothetical protein